MKVSVITVALNAEATIGDAVRSVAAQKGIEVEHILIDGASDDRTVSAACAAAGSTLKVVSERDDGLYDAMNKGVQMATGDLVGFLNADDFLCRTDALALVASAAAGPCDAVGGAVAIVDPNNPFSVKRAYQARGFRSWMLAFGHMPPHPGFYVKRESMQWVGPFDQRLRIGADFEWMVRFFCVDGRRAAFLPQTLVALRLGGLSTRGLASAKLINREALRSLARHRVLSSSPVVWSKYLAKSLQLVRPAVEYPPGPGVRWLPAAQGSR